MCSYQRIVKNACEFIVDNAFWDVPIKWSAGQTYNEPHWLEQIIIGWCKICEYSWSNRSVELNVSKKVFKSFEKCVRAWSRRRIILSKLGAFFLEFLAQCHLFCSIESPWSVFGCFQRFIIHETNLMRNYTTWLSSMKRHHIVPMICSYSGSGSICHFWVTNTFLVFE